MECTGLSSNFGIAQYFAFWHWCIRVVVTGAYDKRGAPKGPVFMPQTLKFRELFKLCEKNSIQVSRAGWYAANFIRFNTLKGNAS